MITGIDEVGDFAKNSNEYNFFIAASVDQNFNNSEIKRQQFEDWEKNIPDSCRENGEVKGRLLNEEHLSNFYNSVIRNFPRILISVVRIKPKENPEEIVFKHNEILCKQIRVLINDAKSKNQHLNSRYLSELYAWCKNRPYPTLLKMQCLMHLQVNSINQCLGFAQATYLADFKKANGTNQNENNIRNLTTYIDKDFIKSDGVRRKWSFITSQFLKSYSKHNKTPILLLPPGIEHPVQKHYQITEDGKINLNPALRNRTHFVDSTDNIYIRIADILCSIFHKQQNRGECKSFQEDLMKILNEKNYQHLILNDVY